MVVSEFLHESLYQIGLIWCAIILIPGWMCVIWQGIKDPVKRFIRWAVRKWERHEKAVQKRRERLEEARTHYYIENIKGTNGYRIRMR